MAQELQTITIAAPGFFGLNTQDSPIGLNPSFASIADNCVIDQYGRVGARKGYSAVTTNGAAVLDSSVGVEMVHQYRDDSGDGTILSAGNNKIFSGTTTLVDETPAGYSISANNWKAVNFNDHVFMVQRGYEPLVYSAHTDSAVAMSDHTHATGTPPEGNEVLAAFGRLFVADFAADKSTVYWSDLLDGTAWSGGSTGSLDVTKHWPNGYDEITALAAHNGSLVIFGKNSILIYTGAVSPASMTLSDTISNIGCIERDTVQNIGTDLIFLSDAGVRSLARTIQEKSAPLRDISRNVRNDLITLLLAETGSIKSVYSPENAFYLLTFPSQDTVYCFDMRSPLEDGSYRATTWTQINPLCFHRLLDGTLYFGHSTGITKYDGYNDGGTGSTYTLSYFSNPLDFGNAANLKFLKKFTLTIIGGQNTEATLNWGYDYTESYTKETFTFADKKIAEYGVSQYNTSIAEYSASIIINTNTFNGTGNGTVVTVGIEATVNDAPFSIQKIDILALLGRLI
tara:strand:+ start:3052 stop:4587 length:1536 start_codon:yes stop_codon:yes gene_type:complete